MIEQKCCVNCDDKNDCAHKCWYASQKRKGQYMRCTEPFACSYTNGCPHDIAEARKNVKV